jgi:hypothetical protein
MEQSEHQFYIHVVNKKLIFIFASEGWGVSFLFGTAVSTDKQPTSEKILILTRNIYISSLLRCFSLF